MERCTECNKELYEETPYCEDCMERQIREQEVKMQEMEAAINEAGKECERLKQAYDQVLDLINDDRKVSNRYEYMSVLPHLIASRDAYIKAVVKHFDETCLPDNLLQIYTKHPSFYQPRCASVSVLYGV